MKDEKAKKDHQERVRAAAEKLMAAHAETFRKLAR
jgi:hypothetical protein